MSYDDDSDSDEVGYKKPPKDKQFKKGQSGNLLTPLKTMSNGTASINSIKDRWAPSRNINPYLNSTVRVKNPDPTIGDWKSIITAKWNSESYNGGPGSFFGVEERLAQDLDGNKLFYLRGEKQQH